MNRIITVSDYGRVDVKLKEQMDAKSIKRGALAKAVGANFEVIDRWYKGNVDRVDLDVLARICAVLDCQVSDLLVYTPESKDA